MIDILIIGSGGAGLTAALEAKRQGLNVTVVSKTYPTQSQTAQAQGGINASFNENDSIQNHIEDTLKSAHELGDINTIKYMCEEATNTIKWLDDMGVPFSRTQSGDIAQRRLGGTKNPRACYSSDYTGLKILHTLYDQVLKENITFLNEHMLLNLIVEESVVKGVTVLDIQSTEVKQLTAKSVIIASGGYGGIYHGFTTNSSATTGDSIAAAFRAGCELANMEYVQFHPTALADSFVLISESARGEGGYLIDQNGNRFVNELLPRDEVARAIFKKIENGDTIYLDLRHLGIEKIKETMPQELALVQQFANLDLSKDIIPIAPAAHYTMGGIKTNIHGATNISNLYAVGEASCNGVHGANRLGGNSLLEIITFARNTINYISQTLQQIHPFNIQSSSQLQTDKEYIEKLFSTTCTQNFYETKNKLGEIFYSNVGIFRDEKRLQETLYTLLIWEKEITAMGIKDKTKLFNTNLKEFIEFTNMIELSKTIVISALQRKESRGAHYRVDFTQENQKFNTETLIKKADINEYNNL